MSDWLGLTIVCLNCVVLGYAIGAVVAKKGESL